MTTALAWQLGRTLTHAERQARYAASAKGKATLKQRQRRYARDGRCVICGGIGEFGGKRNPYCAHHYELVRASNRRSLLRIYWGRVTSGRCARAGCKTKAVAGKVLCGPCANNLSVFGKQRYHRLKRRGLCAECGVAEARFGRVFCGDCAVRQCEASRRWRIQQRAEARA